MIAALLIVAAWALFLGVTMAFCMGAHHRRTPKVPLKPEEVIWFKAVAKVAHRRSA